MDYPRFYNAISKPWRRFSGGTSALAAIDRFLVAVIAAGYGVTLVWLLAQGDARWMRVAAVPFFVLVLVTALRRVINAPRPFETFAIDPLVPGTTKGQSMPSRHVASAVIIACALGYVVPAWGWIAGIASAIVAYARVAGGRHFIRDVVAAALLALVCGYVGFVLL